MKLSPVHPHIQSGFRNVPPSWLERPIRQRARVIVKAIAIESAKRFIDPPIRYAHNLCLPADRIGREWVFVKMLVNKMLRQADLPLKRIVGRSY